MERERENGSRRRTIRVLGSISAMLVVAAAIAVLVSTMWLPIFRAYGKSMSPTINEGEVFAAAAKPKYKDGDIIALWYENKILVKRVIATSGQTIDMDKEGNVYIDGELQSEPYLSEKSYGSCSIHFPVQVPEGAYFVMGDNREISADSRNSEIGLIRQEQIAGRAFVKLWPLSKLGKINGGK